jgi:polyisoprenoid-binding protein YceI
MKKLFLFSVLSLVLSGFVAAQNYSPVDAESSLAFTIKNFGSKVNGSLKDLKGNIVWDAQNPANSSFDVSADANTINTNNGGRDKHLRKEDYFDVAKFPRLNFKSTKITKKQDGNYFVEGQITIKGVTKNIGFTFSAIIANGKLTLQGSFQLNRRDFGVGGGSLILSDNLTVNLTVVAAAK